MRIDEGRGGVEVRYAGAILAKRGPHNYQLALLPDAANVYHNATGKVESECANKKWAEYTDAGES